MTTPTPFVGTPVASCEKGDIILVNNRDFYAVFNKDDHEDNEVNEPDMVGIVLEDAGFNCNDFDYDDSEDVRQVAINFDSDYAVEVIPNKPIGTNRSFARQAVMNTAQENYENFTSQWETGDIKPIDLADQMYRERNVQEIIRDTLGCVTLQDYDIWIGSAIDDIQISEY